MTQPIPSETIEYGTFLNALTRLRERAIRLSQAAATGAINCSTKELADTYRAFGEDYSSFAEEIGFAIAKAARAHMVKSTITIHVEGGMVQHVTGIPAGYEVRVEDRDEGDTSHPSWDAEKGCFVTVYGGDGV